MPPYAKQPLAHARTGRAIMAAMATRTSPSTRTKRRAARGTDERRAAPRPGGAHAVAAAPREVGPLKADRQRIGMALVSSRVGVWDWNVGTGKVYYAISSGDHPPDPSAPDGGFLNWREIDAAEWSANTHPDDVPATRPAIDAVVDGLAESFDIVYRRHREDPQQWEWFEAQGKVVSRLANGRASRIVGTMIIATHRLRQEAERRQIEQAFFQNIRLSTVAEVASGLSHEINQPLTTATMHVQAAERMLRRRTPDRGAALDALHTALAAIERAAAIARRHRQPVKRPGTGWERFDLLTIAKRVVDIMKPDARAADVAIDVSGPRRPLPVDGDPVQVEQVIANLVRNAIESIADAGEPGRVQLILKRVGCLAQVRVADSGPGVAAHVRPSLYLPYVTTKSGGTGLGLALSRTIAEAHGGRLVLEDGTPGETVFLFEWPCTRGVGPRSPVR